MGKSDAPIGKRRSEHRFQHCSSRCSERRFCHGGNYMHRRHNNKKLVLSPPPLVHAPFLWHIWSRCTSLSFLIRIPGPASVLLRCSQYPNQASFMTCRSVAMSVHYTVAALMEHSDMRCDLTTFEFLTSSLISLLMPWLASVLLSNLQKH